MHIFLKAKLQESIERWIENNCEDADFWPDVYTDPDVASLMTDAAAAVFDSAVNVQKYVLSEKLMEKKK